jgi:LDH2 family malate/lactate/ureidoglycolate dehydrogenase
VQVIGLDHFIIILPALALEQFYEALGQFVDMVKNQGLIGPNATNVQTIVPPWKIS